MTDPLDTDQIGWRKTSLAMALTNAFLSPYAGEIFLQALSDAPDRDEIMAGLVVAHEQIKREGPQSFHGYIAPADQS